MGLHSDKSTLLVFWSVCNVLALLSFTTLSGLALSKSARAAEVKMVKIGLRAHRGVEQSLKKWQATADYLNEKIPGYQFVLLPYELNSQLDQAVSRGEFDFVLTNPSAHVEHKIRYDASAIATLINKRKGKGYTRFGSVIFTRAGRNDINTLQDLKGKTFMAVDEKGFGGWRAAWRELQLNQVNPLKDFKTLSFAGGLQQNVVFAVRDGKADAGSVRTDMLERMAQRGEIQLDSYKVLNPQVSKDFAFLHSTRLYPEWPFAKLSHTSDELTRKVAAVLYNIPPDSNAAKAGKYVGWTVALDYQPVVDLLRELHVGPFVRGPMSLGQILEQYWQITLALTAFIILALITIIAVSKANRQLETEIKERIKAQQALRDQQLHLEEMVAERTNALELSNKELESYSYSIAHDLRTPLRSIVGFSQIIKQDASIKLNDEEISFVDRIVSAGKHMGRLIDDILELSRISRIELDKKQVNLSEIAHQIIKQLESGDTQHQVQWHIQGNLLVNGDHQLLTILIQNLLENAWKFTHDVARATVELGKNEGDDTTVYYVRDNGVGFDTHNKEKIFLPFQRAHGAEIEGTGIGLASAHRVVQRHGGDIWVDKNPDRGVTFFFTLKEPAKAPEQKQDSALLEN